MTWSQIHGVSALAGIGFTMAFFISELAFKGHALGEVARVGILSASVISALLGFWLLWRSTPRAAPEKAS